MSTRPALRLVAPDSPEVRIDPMKGYVPDNIAVISYRANRMKGEATIAELEQLLQWAKKGAK